MSHAKNLILYGPPGTGKTYSTVIHAVAIIENRNVCNVETEEYAKVLEKYKYYMAIGLIEFVTFHQNYGYEDFIEGIRPVIERPCSDNSQVGYRLEYGAFKKFCMSRSNCSNYWILQSNPTVDNGNWEFNLNPNEETFYRISHFDDVANRLSDVRVGDIALAYEASSGKNSFLALCRVTKVDTTNDDTGKLVKGNVHVRVLMRFSEKLSRADLKALDLNDKYFANTLQRTLYHLEREDYNTIIKSLIGSDTSINMQTDKVFIIDEINRGNISKIFGELITLIEADKREGMPEARSCILPYSKMSFSVPSNVYILGTMNTADRSLTRLDTALRRRFEFEEMMPKPELLDFNIGEINIKDLLTKMNERIEALYDREHQIGHAYFWKLKQQYDDSNQSNPTINDLAIVMKKKIIPLLQEYFFDDWEKIRLILGDNQKWNDQNHLKENEIEFIEEKSNDLFGKKIDEVNCVYRISESAFERPDAYHYLGLSRFPYTSPTAQQTQSTEHPAGNDGEHIDGVPTSTDGADTKDGAA